MIVPTGESAYGGFQFDAEEQSDDEIRNTKH